MNLLLDKLPEHLSIGGIPHKIRSDFRTWIKIENLLFWDGAPWGQRIANILYQCYTEGIPTPIDEGIRAAMGFYSCIGSEKIEATSPSDVKEREKKEQKPTGWKNRVYSFNHDAGLIYAAFRAQYGINLQTSEMHWWEFNALFSGLTEGNKICKIMEFRAADLSSFKDKETKTYYRKMKRVYRLPDPRSEEEQETDMMDVLATAF